ncbi:MAG: carboxypeptidase regulatory-like domain-containing protein [Longimicrobiales bacterium]
MFVPRLVSSMRTALVTIALVSLVVLPVRAQTVVARVVDDASGQPLIGALVHLVGSDGALNRSALTDDLGRALFIGTLGEDWRVRAEMIGRATTEVGPFSVGEGETLSREIRMASSAIVLEGIDVSASERCEIRGGNEGMIVADVWNEARKALAAASITDNRGLYRYETVRYDREIDAYSSAILTEDRRRRSVPMRTPFESRPAEELVRGGFVQDDGGSDVYYAPDATALLSDAFLDTHCFRLAGERNDEGFIGLEFEPTEDREVPDIEGVMWLDPNSAELQWLEYRYTGLARERRSPQVGGRVDFRRMPDGSWIVPEWWIRMPVVGVSRDFEGTRTTEIVRYHQTGGLVMEVKEAGGRGLGRMARTGGIEGVVRDSVGVPLRGVRVGVVGSNQEVYSNAEGRYSITGLPEGRYRVRFVDERLEIMGYVPGPLERDVVSGEMSWLEYVTPSVGDVLFEVCRDEDVAAGLVSLAGIVADRNGQGVPLATVRVEFTEFRLPSGLILQDRQWMEITTTRTGFFKFCGVPPDTRLTVDASLDDVTSDPMVLEIPAHEMGRMLVIELFSGTGAERVP